MEAKRRWPVVVNLHVLVFVARSGGGDPLGVAQSTCGSAPKKMSENFDTAATSRHYNTFRTYSSVETMGRRPNTGIQPPT